MFLTFNELSALTTSLKSESDARALIDEFVLFCKELQEKNIVDKIISTGNLYSIYLYAEYGISQWFNDTCVKKNYKQFFKRFLDKYFTYFNQCDIGGEFTISIGKKDSTSLGGAFALEHNYALLSLSTHKFWENKVILGKYSPFDTDSELQASVYSLNNLWTKASIEDADYIYKKELTNNITSGQDLWENRKKLYPNLEFCENVKDQLYEDSEKYHIDAVMERLNCFQVYFSNCDSKFDPKKLGMGARSESETVKSDPNLKNYRKFRLPNGDEEYFFDHVSFSGKYSGGRIHFLPDNSNKKCYIGYIGKHLPTKKF